MKVDFSLNNMVSFAGAFDDALVRSNVTISNLLLSENQLGAELGDEGILVFANFKDLYELDLSSNNIKTLPQSIFENLDKLEFLHLKRNSLLTIEFRFSHMRSLQLLDLSENLLSRFNSKLQSDIDAVKSQSPNFTINMLGNPFQCSCETRLFFWWMYRRRSMFEGFANYTCIYSGKFRNFSDMTKLLQTMNVYCSSNLIAKVSSGLLSFLIFVIALSVFLCHHKWDVRFFFIKYIMNRKAYQEFEESEEEYEYDAFVSFHSDDQDWVWNELHKNLDKTQDTVKNYSQPRFRLCIHERDFIPGDLIEENILRSIESSRKTIVVLSRNFLQSVWCEFELQIARRECIERGRNIIIAIILESLPVDIKISRSVERLIRKKTYIKWPAEPSERAHFWEQMRSALIT